MCVGVCVCVGGVGVQNANKCSTLLHLAGRGKAGTLGWLGVVGGGGGGEGGEGGARISSSS